MRKILLLVLIVLLLILGAVTLHTATSDRLSVGLHVYDRIVYVVVRAANEDDLTKDVTVIHGYRYPARVFPGISLMLFWDAPRHNSVITQGGTCWLNFECSGDPLPTLR